MCNVDDDGERRPTKINPRSQIGKKCVKCDQQGVLMTRIQDSFCKACFQVYVIHKFRAAIGKSKLIRQGEHVMVAFSGGINSAALLHLIQDGLSERAHRKLRFTPTLLHIDECGVLDIPESTRQETCQKVACIMQKSGFPSYMTFLEQVMNIEKRSGESDGSRDLAVCTEEVLSQTVFDFPSISEVDRLKALISHLSSTSQEDVLRNLRTQVIVAVARQMGITKVLTADCSTRLSIRILTDIAQGRGAQVSLNTGFADERNGDVVFIRAVKDVSAKELALYNNMFGVESIFIPSLMSKTSPASSIGRLTETFVTGLQASFPSTVSNIVRTSEKLGRPDLQKSAKCSFCQSPLDTHVGKASALYAIEFSQKLSQSAAIFTVTEAESDHHILDQDQTQPVTSSCGQRESTVNERARCTRDELFGTLCYGCRLSLHNISDPRILPSFILQEAVQDKQREILREQISEFLLEDASNDR